MNIFGFRITRTDHPAESEKTAALVLENRLRGIEGSMTAVVAAAGVLIKETNSLRQSIDRLPFDDMKKTQAAAVEEMMNAFDHIVDKYEQRRILMELSARLGKVMDEVSSAAGKIVR